MKKFLLDSFLFFYLFYYFTVILLAVNSSRSLWSMMHDDLLYSLAPWLFIGPLALLFSVFRNKTTTNKAYLIVIGFFWTLFLSFLPIVILAVVKYF